MPRALTPQPPGGPESGRIHEILRVDHAGEYGAMCIYEGQLAVFSGLPHKARTTALLRRMAAEEQRHKETFDALMVSRGVRPTVMMPIWRAAGVALGAATALLGEKAAMTCTSAVEEVIDGHYAGQIRDLENMQHATGRQENALRNTLAGFREDERAHRDTALREGAETPPGHGLLAAAIRAACRAAIRVSEKL